VLKFGTHVSIVGDLYTWRITKRSCIPVDVNKTRSRNTVRVRVRDGVEPCWKYLQSTNATSNWLEVWTLYFSWFVSSWTNIMVRIYARFTRNQITELFERPGKFELDQLDKQRFLADFKVQQFLSTNLIAPETVFSQGLGSHCCWEGDDYTKHSPISFSVMQQKILPLTIYQLRMQDCLLWDCEPDEKS